MHTVQGKGALQAPRLLYALGGHIYSSVQRLRRKGHCLASLIDVSITVSDVFLFVSLLNV